LTCQLPHVRSSRKAASVATPQQGTQNQVAPCRKRHTATRQSRCRQSPSALAHATTEASCRRPLRHSAPARPLPVPPQTTTPSPTRRRRGDTRRLEPPHAAKTPKRGGPRHRHLGRPRSPAGAPAGLHDASSPLVAVIPSPSRSALRARTRRPRRRRGCPPPPHAQKNFIRPNYGGEDKRLSSNQDITTANLPDEDHSNTPPTPPATVTTASHPSRQSAGGGRWEHRRRMVA
jgi:hypothetical protein